MTQGRVRNHLDLKVWQLSIELAVEVYRESSALPRSELFGLASQLRRASASVPANIAEGAGRESTKEFMRFLSIASGSLAELETHLMLCEKLHLLNASEDLWQHLRGVRIMIKSLRDSLRKRVR